MSYFFDKITDKNWSFKSYQKMVSSDKFLLDGMLLSEDEDELVFCRELNDFREELGNRPASILLMACGCVFKLECYELLRLVLQLMYFNCPNDDRIERIFNDPDFQLSLNYGKCWPRYDFNWMQAEVRSLKRKYNVDLDELNREEKINFSMFAIQCSVRFVKRNRYNYGDEIAIIKSYEYMTKVIEICRSHIVEELNEKAG